MRAVWRVVAAVAVGIYGLGSGVGEVLGAEATAMEEVLGILRSEGVIDEATQERLLAKHVREQKRAASDAAGLLGGLEWYGDLRLRYEAIRFDTDELGSERDNRDRFRYRARFGFKKRVNDWLQVGVRLASGGGDLDSTNRSFGESADFAGDGIFFDRAWLDLTVLDADDWSMHLVGGRVANPFTWKRGKDFLVWDGDINMTGAHLTTSFTPGEDTEVFATVGSFIARERSGDADPKILGAQVGLVRGPFGIRTSLYEYRSLEEGFILDNGASRDDGNLVNPLAIGVRPDMTQALNSSGLEGAFDDGRARVVDVTAVWQILEGDFPVMVYGTFARNLNAESIGIPAGTLLLGTPTTTELRAGDEGDAWGLGFEIGDKKKSVLLGAGYFSVEANSVVAQFTDSDLFDGKTNREGFILYASRRIATNTDFNLTYFDSEEIEDSPVELFGSSLGDADRKRLQADIQVSF